VQRHELQEKEMKAQKTKNLKVEGSVVTTSSWSVQEWLEEKKRRLTKLQVRTHILSCSTTAHHPSAKIIAEQTTRLANCMSSKAD
jgi:hypothetical protein